MTSTRPPTQPPSPATPAALEPQSDGASKIVLSAEEAHARATADLELFERVFRLISPRLQAQARKHLKSKADAEDKVQDVFASAWDNDVIRRCAAELRRMVAYLTKAM